MRAGLRRESVAAAGERAEEAEAHGLQRWQQGIGCARSRANGLTCSAACLTSCTTTPPRTRASTPAVLHAAYRGLVELCSEGISDSTGQYFHLEQIEALGQVRDLSQTLDQLRTSSVSVRSSGDEAAHDLRGNFGVVANATAGLTMQAVPEPMREEFFRLLQNSVSSVHSMLEDVMTLARLQAGQERGGSVRSMRRCCFVRYASASSRRQANGDCSCVRKAPSGWT